MFRWDKKGLVVYFCVTIVLLLSASSAFVACAGPEECVAPKKLVDGKCVDANPDAGSNEPTTTETAKETAQETANDAAEEVTPEPTQEVQPEPKQEVHPELTPEPEPVQEEATTPETQPEEATVVEEATPEPPPVEVTPEARGPAPTVKITEPATGKIAKGTISVKVDASVTGGPKIDRVELHIDGKKNSETQSQPYTFSVDTTSLTDGKHKVTAIAFTDWGKSAKATIEIDVANKGPKVEFVKPKLDAEVSGKVDIELKITSSVGVDAAKVTLFIDVDGAVSQAKWTATSPTYKAQLDISKQTFYGAILFIAKATDKNGNATTVKHVALHLPAAGTAKRGDVCDNADPKKRCIKGHYCLPIGGTKKCHVGCTVGKTLQCSFNGSIVCKEAFEQPSQRGICVAKTGPSPGSLYSACSSTSPCKGANLLCVTGPTQKSFCLERCTGTGGKCSANGFYCIGVQGGGGVCVEKCGGSCKSNTDCVKGQSCSGGTCSAPYCANYGKCTSLTGLTFKICI